jgi:hypothetical protein
MASQGSDTFENLDSLNQSLQCEGSQPSQDVKYEFTEAQPSQESLSHLLDADSGRTILDFSPALRQDPLIPLSDAILGSDTYLGRNPKECASALLDILGGKPQEPSSEEKAEYIGKAIFI